MNKIKILIPIYNDWQSVFKLLMNINDTAATIDSDLSVIIINDASNHKRPLLTYNLDNLKSRPVWEGNITQEKLDSYLHYVCIENICVGNR